MKFESQTKSLLNFAATVSMMVVCFLFAALVIPDLTPSAHAASAQALQQQVREANSRIAGMESNLETALNALQTANRKLGETEVEIAETEEQAELVKEDIALNRAQLERQVDFMYRSSGHAYLEVIFSSRSFTELTAALQLVDMLASNDAQTLENLRVQTAQLEGMLSDLEDLRDRQSAIQSAKQADANSAQSTLNQQQSYIASLNTQVQQALQAEAEAARRAAASSPAAPSGSNRSSGEAAGNSRSSSRGSGGGNYVGTGTIFTGIASWYEIGTRTANGERFNPDAMTAAHPSLPFGTLVRVTFRGNSVVVRINDRGPFTGGRIIDLSRGSAQVIGLRSAGVGQVTVEIVQRP